jgi:hypothetical protein
MNPKVKAAATIAARHERMTLSTFLERALEEKTQRIEHYDFNVKTSLADILAEIWHPLEPVRFVLQADRLPSTLTDEEIILWNLIQQSDTLWHTGPGGERINRDGNAKNGLKFELLQKQWDALQAKAKSIAAKESTELINGFPFKGGRAASSVVTDKKPQRGKK